jgi:hypothetical protein
MRRHLIPTFTVIAGLALGWLAAPGERKAGTEETTLLPDPSSAALVGQRRGHDAASPDSPEGHDFASYAGRVAHPAEQIDAEQAATRMSSGELREVLLTAPERSNLVPSPEDKLRQIALDAAATELLLREGKTAISWSEKSGSKATRVSLLKAFLAADPREAKESLQAFYSDYGGDLSFIFEKAAFNAATLRSAAALREAQEAFGDRIPKDLTDFAKDFDFAGYFAVTANPYQIPPELITTWFARDPKGATAGLADAMRTNPAMGNSFRAALEARTTLGGEDEAMRSLLPVVAAAPEQARLWAFTSLLPLDDARRESLLAKLPDNDQGRSDLATAGVLRDLDQAFGGFHVMSGQFGTSLQSRSLGEALPDESQQIQALKKAIELNGKRHLMVGGPADKAAMLKLIMADWQISASGQEEVLANLPAR